MRIAIIAAGHTSSGIPLAKAFLDAGHHVDFYLFRDHRPCVQDAIEFKKNSFLFGIKKIKREDTPELFEYINNSNFSLYCVAITSLIKNITFLRFFYKEGKEYVRFAHKVNAQKYDFINIIGRHTHTEFIDLIANISAKKAVTLHEVCDHFSPSFDTPSPLLDYLFKNNIRIIVHSYNSFHSINKYKECNSSNIDVIPFGTLDTFKNLVDNSITALPKKYILFIGLISQYKGLDILYKALETVELNDYKIVVAGSGYVSTVDLIKDDKRYVYIPGYVSNKMFATLISNCSFVVCPYLSMSQSGIPQSAFAFNKPVIASDLDGFKEIIQSGYNGILFRCGDTYSLSECIKKLIDNESVLKNISDNISEFKEDSKDYSWSCIQTKYLK